MAIVDVWHADDSYSLQGDELSSEIADWPLPKENNPVTLRLEELTQFHVDDRIQVRERNLVRLQMAKLRKDIQHLEVHFTCCTDKIQSQALFELLGCDNREWISFTLQGINSINDFFAKPTSLTKLSDLLIAMKRFQAINLYSCSAQYRGHGLEEILKTLPFLTELRDLRLHGWQMDRVSTESLTTSLAEHDSIQLLSLRSCMFLGEDTFENLVECLSSMPQLHTLNLSYCDLRDTDITRLAEKFKDESNLQNVHIGGNYCISPSSVNAIADWLMDESCKLKDLNLRALWVGFSEEGLMQRFVSLQPLFQSIESNRSLLCLTVSENCLDNVDIQNLCRALKQNDKLVHLDVGDNPFSESGAESLLSLVNEGIIESSRFENHFMDYKCGGYLKFMARVNYTDKRLCLVDEMPLSVWSQVFSQVQQDCKGKFDSTDFSPDIIFRMLHTSTGQFGHPLSFRIATTRN